MDAIVIEYEVIKAPLVLIISCKTPEKHLKGLFITCEQLNEYMMLQVFYNYIFYYITKLDSGTQNTLTETKHV